jgi:hypothetical protein
MPFPVNSLYEIHEKGKAPFFVRVIHSTSEIHKTKVVEVKSGKEKYLFEYLKNDAEIYHIPDDGGMFE